MPEEKKDPLWLVGLPGGMFLVGRAAGPPGEWISLRDPLAVFEVPNPDRTQKNKNMLFGMKPFLFAVHFPELTVRPIVLQLITGPTTEMLEPLYERALLEERAMRAGIAMPMENKLSSVPEDPAGGVFRAP